jgi:hypothetical protein
LTGTYNGLFQLWARKDNTWDGYDTGKQMGRNATGTLFDFIEHTKTRHQFTGDSCNVPFRIESYDAASKKGKIQWGSQMNGCRTPGPFSVVERSDFEVINAAGKDVLIVPTPAIHRTNNTTDDKPYIIFAQQRSTSNVPGIWSGSYSPVSFKQSIPFTGDPSTNSQIISRVMFDAILKQQGIAAYPYTSKSSSGTFTGNIAPRPADN